MERLKDSSLIGTIGIGLFAVGIASVLIAAQFAALPAMAHLHFDGYVFLSLTSAVGTLLIVSRMIATKSHSEETSWFLLVLLGQILFAGGEALQRASTDRAAAVFWSEISGAGASVLGAALLLFAIAYTRPARLRASNIAPLLLWTTMLLVAFYCATNVIFNNNPLQSKQYPWGYNTAPGSAFWVLSLWIILPGIIAGTLMLRYRRHNDNPLLRSQSLLFSVAILVPIAVAGITDVLLPSIGITSIPPLATFAELLTCVVIYYGIRRYQFFKISPAILAENVLSTMNEAVLVTKADFSIEYVNNEAEKLLGLVNGKLSGIYMHTLFTAESWGKINEFMQGKRQISTSDDFGDITVIDQTGNQTPVRVLISGLEEGQFKAYIFVITNISDIVTSYKQLENDANRIRNLLDESHHLQEQLKAEKENVEQIVEVRTRQLRIAQEELKESDKLKTEFIMLGSHNLRTPITIMASSLELLKSINDPQEREKIMGTLDTGIGRLRGFVEDMVAIATLEAGSGLQHEPVTMNELLKPIVTDANALASTKAELSFTANLQDTSTIIMANASRLRGALNNLISNAFKFTSAGSITLSGQVVDGKYRVMVQDTGIGISAEELPRIFTKFHRATDTLKYQYDGKGIGLYLSKLIIDEHGGSLTAESTPGGGSTFTALLPISKPGEIEVHDAESLETASPVPTSTTE